MSMTPKQKITFDRLVAGGEMLVPVKQTCSLAGFNQDGDAIISRVFPTSPNRQWRYLVNTAGKIVGFPL